MLKYLIILISFNALSAEYSLEFASNSTVMEWKGASHAKYDYNLKTLGFVLYNDNIDNDFGVRMAYGKGRATLPRNGAAIPYLIIELKHAIDLEILYRHELFKDTFAQYSLGYCADNLPITSTKSDFYKDDWDSDPCWSAGIEHKMTSHGSILFIYRHRGTVGSSQQHNGALGSSHKSIGVSIRYTF